MPDPYFTRIIDLLSLINEKESENIRAAGRLVYEAVSGGHFWYTFGTGHGHMLAEEVFYRAGGLVRVKPIFREELMLHIDASAGTEAERREGLAAELLDEYGLGGGDVLTVASNSGRNAVPVEMAMTARERGAKVIALTNLNHSGSVASRHPSGKKLFEVADIVIDNHGTPGDACVPIGDGFVAPSSTVAGAAILQAIVAQACMHGDMGVMETFLSSNIDGGDAVNSALIKKYKGIIKSL